MAYADQGMSRGKMIALGIAIVIHVFLGYALITGLALKIVKHIVEPIKSVNIKDTPPPPDEPPPPPPKDVEIPPFVPPPEVTVASDVPPPITVQSVQAPPPQVYQPPAPKAEPAPPPPAPTGPTQAATGIGNSTSISEDDYPPASLRAEEQGRTVISFSVNAQGRVDSCSVTTSSGFPKLDDRTCELAKKRFRFKPALQNGTPVASTKTQSVKWQITSK